MGIFFNFWLFMMLAHQIWSCHVTQEANFEFCLSQLGKVTIFLVEKLSTSEVISQKPHGEGGKHPSPPPPPIACRVKRLSLSKVKIAVLL